MKRAPTMDASGVPLALPTVEFRIDEAGSVSVTIDREPYEIPGTLRRDGVRRLVQDLANAYGPIRVVIVEADGEAFIDIETPREEASDPPPRPVDKPSRHRSTGVFQPGEDVLVAVVVDRRTPGSNGHLSLHVPPMIAQRYGDAVYLIGQTSRAIVPLTEVTEASP